MRGLPKLATVTLLVGLLLTGAVLMLNPPAARAAPGEPAVQWKKTYGGSDWDVASSLVQTSDGGYALAGVTESYGAGGYDFWLVKLGVSVQYNLTTSAKPPEGGSITLDPPDGIYAKSAKVTITANPAKGYEFDKWSGDCPEGRKSDAQISLTIDSDKSLNANFTSKKVTKPSRHFPWVLVSIVVLVIIIGIGATWCLRRSRAHRIS